MYTLDELMEQLEEIRETYGGDVAVRLAMQPSWPFEYSIGDAVVVERCEGEDESDKNSPVDYSDVEEEVVVYIAEGAQLGYLPGGARQELGW